MGRSLALHIVVRPPTYQVEAGHLGELNGVGKAAVDSEVHQIRHQPIALAGDQPDATHVSVVEVQVELEAAIWMSGHMAYRVHRAAVGNGFGSRTESSGQDATDRGSGTG